MGEHDSGNVGGAEELKQLNFSVRLGKAIVTVDTDGEVFLLRYRPSTPGGPCYEWQCNADGSIEETGNPDVSPDVDRLCRAFAVVEKEQAASLERFRQEMTLEDGSDKGPPNEQA